jgi:hypothetical protein
MVAWLHVEVGDFLPSGVVKQKRVRPSESVPLLYDRLTVNVPL